MGTKKQYLCEWVSVCDYECVFGRLQEGIGKPRSNDGDNIRP